MKTIKKVTALCLVVVMMTTILTGCSGGGNKAAPDAGQDSSGNSVGGEAQSIVRYTMTSIPKIDPGVGSDMAATTFFVNAYDPLVMPVKDGSVIPWVATEWKVSDDGLIWEFKLRTDITFHSGNKLTARDVAYTMNRMVKLGEGFGYLFNGTIKEAVAVDDYTVKFECSKVSGALLSALVRLYILDSELVKANYGSGDYGEFGDYGKAFLLENDAGSGPYKLKQYMANTYIHGEKFKDYWAGLDPNNPEEFKLIGSNEAVTVKTMMSRQELEIADKYQSSENITAMAAIDGVEIMPTQTGSVIYLLLNNKKAPTDDVHIRRALAYMLDYNTICSQIFPESKQADSIIPSSVLGYKKMHNFEYNIEKAKEEIAQSKYASNIKDYPIEVSWVAETPDREKLALLIQAVASQAGVNVKVVKTPWASVVENSTRVESTPNVTTTLWSANYSEAGAVLEASIRSKPVGTWSNCCWIGDSNLDEMIDKSLATIKKDLRIKQYEDIQDYLADKCVLIPVAETPERLAYQASYVDWKAGQQDELIPVMGYIYYMKNIFVYPEKRK
ncbi:MAG TPA: ABC transporter substrate-binding protein [Clostridia bacterium]|nr:ABC transporter substrate-binding protein [Clostridia bacterium]